MNATLPYVELLPRRLERRLQLLELTRTPKRAHQVERAVVLLRRQRDVADRLLVVSVWISRQRDRPADCAPDEALLVAARNVLVHECAHLGDRLRTIGRERGDVLRWRLDVRWWFHGFTVTWKKGETSGHVQRVVEMRIDCDQDAVWLKVEQAVAACHTGRRSCFYRAVPLGEAGATKLEFRDDKMFDPKADDVKRTKSSAP